MPTWKELVSLDVAVWVLICLAWFTWEVLGLLGGRDSLFTFTHCVRWLMRRKTPWGFLWRSVLMGTWLWIGWHFFLHNPTRHPGA